VLSIMRTSSIEVSEVSVMRLNVGLAEFVEISVDNSFLTG